MTKTGYFYGQHKRRLFYQSWKVKNPRGIFVITHGLSENSDRYDDFARILNKDHWNVYAWDLRGHGRSMGIRGYVRKFRLFERDLVHFLDFIMSKEERLPFVLFGHSLGALIICRGLLHEEDIITSADGICLTAPALGLKVNVSLFKLLFSYVSHIVCPWLVYYNKILSSYLSRDPYFQNVIENDIFRHNRISPEIYFSLLKNPAFIKEPLQVDSRFLIQVPGQEVVVDNKITQNFFYHLKSSCPKKLICYPESMHQILEDYGRDKVIQDLKSFIRPILEG